MSVIYPKRIKSILNGEKPVITFGGYNKSEVKKEVVDVIKDKDEVLREIFIEDGKRYFYRNGIKINAKFLEPNETQMPLFCSKCNHIMTSKLDDKMYYMHGVCFECAIKIEDSLRISGKWQIYEQQKILLNKKSFIVEMLDEVNLIISNGISSIITHVNQEGEMEKWNNESKAEIEEYLQSEKIKLEELLKEVNDELEQTGEIIYVDYSK